MSRYLGVVLLLASSLASANGLKEVHTWCCGPSAPGGCDRIEADTGLFCITGMPGPCNPAGNETYHITRALTGTMGFGDKQVGFIEFLMKRPKERPLFYRIYEPAVKDGESPSDYPAHHAETNRYPGADNFDPTLPFKNWEEVRCSGK